MGMVGVIGMKGSPRYQMQERMDGVTVPRKMNVSRDMSGRDEGTST